MNVGKPRWHLFTNNGSLIFMSVMAVIVMEAVIKLPLSLNTADTFVGFYDREFSFLSVYLIVEELANQEMIFWSIFDNIPTSYLRVVGGIYALDHLLAAIVLSIAHVIIPLENPVTYFYAYEITTTVIFSTLKFLTCYYFVRSFSSPISSLVSTVIFCLLASTHLSVGFGFKFLYLLSFVVVGTLIRVIKEPNVNNIGILLCALSATVFTAPLFTFSYFYLGVNCFILSAILGFLIFQTDRINQIRTFSVKVWSSITSKKIIPYVLFSVSLNIPYLFLYNHIKSLSFALESSRFGSMGSFLEYLRLPHTSAILKNFPMNITNFESASWGGEWPLIGTLSIFLLLFGLFRNSNRLKWIFTFQIILFLLMNAGDKDNQLAIWFHILNFLTNPLAVTNRSFHMTGALMFFLPLMGLVGLGLDALRDDYEKLREANKREIPAYSLIASLSILTIMFSSTLIVLESVSIISYVLLPIPLFFFLRSRTIISKKLAKIFLVTLFVFDLAAFARYHERTLANIADEGVAVNELAVKHRLGAGYSSKFQSPFTDNPPKNITVIPEEKAGYAIETMFSGQSLHRGFIKGETFWSKLYFPPNQYRPKHDSFVSLTGDKEFLQVLDKNPTIFWALPDNYKQFRENASLLQASKPIDWQLSNAKSSRIMASGDGSILGNIMILTPFDRKMRIMGTQGPVETFHINNTFTGISFKEPVSELSLEYDPNNLARIGFPIAATLYISFCVFFAYTVFRKSADETP